MKFPRRSTDEQKETPRRVMLTPRNVAASVLVAVAVTFAALAGVQLRDHHDAELLRTNDASILSAASTGVTALISMSDSSADEDIQNVLAQSTGTFQKDMEARSEKVVEVFKQAKVEQQGQVVAEGIQSRDGDSAVVLVFATSTVSNLAGAENESHRWSLRVTMTDDDGVFKMSNVEFVA